MTGGTTFLRCSLIDFASWQCHNLHRIAFRAAWQQYFRNFDAFLLPALPVPAFPPDHTEQARRTLATPEGPLPYLQALLSYMSVAILTGCPATVAPAGKTAKGLPVGIRNAIGALPVPLKRVSETIRLWRAIQSGQDLFLFNVNRGPSRRRVLERLFPNRP